MSGKRILLGLVALFTNWDYCLAAPKTRGEGRVKRVRRQKPPAPIVPVVQSNSVVALERSQPTSNILPVDTAVICDNVDIVVNPVSEAGVQAPSIIMVENNNFDAGADNVEQKAGDTIAKELTDTDVEVVRNCASWQVVYQCVIDLASSVVASVNESSSDLIPVFPLPSTEAILQKTGETAIEVADYLALQMKSCEAGSQSYLAYAHNYLARGHKGKIFLTMPSFVENSNQASWFVSEVFLEGEDYIQVQGCLCVTQDVSLQVAYTFKKPAVLVLSYVDGLFDHDVSGSFTVALDIVRGIEMMSSAICPVSCALSVLKKV